MTIWAWWRHQMETSSALLSLCARNSSVTGEFPSQRPVTRSFDVFFELRANKRSSELSRRRWFETPSCSLWRPCNGHFRGCNSTCRILFNNIHIGQVSPQLHSARGHLLTHCGLMTLHGGRELGQLCSGNGLLSDDSKPLPEPMLTNHWWSLGEFTRWPFHRKCARYLSFGTTS